MTLHCRKDVVGAAATAVARSVCMAATDDRRPNPRGQRAVRLMTTMSEEGYEAD